MSTFINCYLIVSEVSTGKSQTDTLPYNPSDSEVNIARSRFEIPHKDRTFEVNKLFVIWLFALSLRENNALDLADQSARFIGCKHKPCKKIALLND